MPEVKTMLKIGRYAENESAIIWIYTQFPLAHNKKQYIVSPTQLFIIIYIIYIYIYYNDL